MCVFALALAAVPINSVRAADREVDEARAFHERAKAAFALSHYAQAAEYFEKAFELRADPALLYNAAQSHRLAGNKERALTLYQNYLRFYGKDERRASIESRIDELKRAIEHDRAAGVKPPSLTPAAPAPALPSSAASPAPTATSGATAPGAVSSPPPSTTPSTTPSTAPSSAPSSAPTAIAPPPSAPAPAPDNNPPGAMLVSQPGTPAGDDVSVTKKPWFWIAIGGGVAVAAAAVLFLTLSHTKDPSGTFGQINGN